MRKIWAVLGKFDAVSASCRMRPCAGRKKQRPPGEEVRRASLMMIGNWEEECCQPYRRGAGRRSAPLRIHVDLRIRSVGSFGIMPGVRPVRPPVSPVALRYAAPGFPGPDHFRSDGCTIAGLSILCTAIWVWMVCACCMSQTGSPVSEIYQAFLYRPLTAAMAARRNIRGDCEFPASLYRLPPVRRQRSVGVCIEAGWSAISNAGRPRA